MTDTSSTLIDNIHTDFDENITFVHVSKIAVSDHYAIFGNRKLNNCVKSNTHQAITYQSFENFDESKFIHDLYKVPWEICEYFDEASMKLLMFGICCFWR